MQNHQLIFNLKKWYHLKSRIELTITT